MTYLEAIILGAIQGLTEFLPVSSSGHLELANHVLNIQEPDNLQFTIAVHAGTVLSTIVVFAKDLGRIISGLFRFKMNSETMFVINIVISMLPILFIGMFFRDGIESLFTSNLLLVGLMLLVTATLLTFSHYAKPKQRPVTLKSAFIIGIAQAVAVLPGLSRSGATISTGLMLGVKRDEVSRFSFLMVIIPIIGMNFLDIISGDMATSTIPTGIILTGFITAFITGAIACKLMISIVNRGKLIWFAVYCAAVGLASIIGNFL